MIDELQAKADQRADVRRTAQGEIEGTSEARRAARAARFKKPEPVDDLADQGAALIGLDAEPTPVSAERLKRRKARRKQLKKIKGTAK